MLRYFSVSGYKNFDRPVELDFSDARDYQFNGNCINNGLLGKIIIYGKNASGKSNFAQALADIYSILPGKSAGYEKGLYLNIHNTNGYAEFTYVFQFDNDTVEYIYRKTAPLKMIYEQVSLNGQLLFCFDRHNPGGLEAPGLKELAPTLNLAFENVENVFGYVIANTPLDSGHPLRKVRAFVDCVKLDAFSEGLNSYTEVYSELVANTAGVFIELLTELLQLAGVSDQLTVLEDLTGKKGLFFDTVPPMPFTQAASSGTKALCSLSMLYAAAKFGGAGRPALFILDEFDAFYHHELAERIVKMFLEYPHVQVVFTSHNTSLLSNRFMRPDCFFIMTHNKLTSFANATQRELREGHNLEKLFVGGEFDA